MKVENWFPWYGRGFTINGMQRQVKLILFSDLTFDLLQQFSLSCHCMESEGENPAIFCFTGSRVRLKERIHRTWKVLTGIWFMTSILLYPAKSTQHPARSSSMWYAWNVPCIFAVWAYMFKNWSLKTNCYLNILFIVWFLYVLFSITLTCFMEHPTQREGICSLADKQLKLCSILRFSLLLYVM